MQVISSASTAAARGRASILAGSVVGGTLLAGGLALGWLMIATSFVTQFTPPLRPQPGEVAMAIVAWAVAFVAPATFLIVGVARIADVIDAIVARRAHAGAAWRLRRALGDEYAVATRVRLPDGRPVPELVLGPFGAAVLVELPPAAATRHRQGAWEVRTPRGWTTLENPLERATRDAERVRRWFASDDRDFLVKVYAAVVGSDPQVTRTASCAVIAPDQIAAWLASLPAQRSLTPSRRESLVERLREIR